MKIARREVLTLPEFAHRRGVSREDYAAFVADVQREHAAWRLEMTRIECHGWSIPAVVVERSMP